MTVQSYKSELLLQLKINSLPAILNACLDEALELQFNSTVDGSPLIESIPPEKFQEEVFLKWKRYFQTARKMNVQHPSTTAFHFRGVELNFPPQYWEQLEHQLSQLID